MHTRPPRRRQVLSALTSATLTLACLALAGCDPVASDACGVGANEGGSDVPPTFPIEMGRNEGAFQFDYETRNAKDRVEVFYEGALLFDSGCVGESRSVPLTYGPGTATHIDVVISPNCAGTPMTSWRFEVGCPEPRAPFAQSVEVGKTGAPRR